MLMINATRHLDANLSGVYPRPSIWVGKAMRRFGEGGAAATRQQFKQGVGNERFNQIMGWAAGLP
jgi:hypothetical protein